MASGGVTSNNPLDIVVTNRINVCMTASELIAIQDRMGVTGAQLARWLNTTPLTVTRWRGGNHVIPGPAALAIKALSEGYRP